MQYTSGTGLYLNVSTRCVGENPGGHDDPELDWSSVVELQLRSLSVAGVSHRETIWSKVAGQSLRSSTVSRLGPVTAAGRRCSISIPSVARGASTFQPFFPPSSSQAPYRRRPMQE